MCTQQQDSNFVYKKTNNLCISTVSHTNFVEAFKKPISTILYNNNRKKSFFFSNRVYVP